MSDTETVLVTGGSGFIGGWCIVELLRRGYRVRTTLRDMGRMSEVRTMVSQEIDPAGRLTFFAADLTRDAGWAEAARGCDYVLHVASPFPANQPKDASDLILPAREGTLRVLRASLEAGVKRVVLTSSSSAMAYSRKTPAPNPLTEEDWTDPAHPHATPYVRSKTIAERAAWDFVSASGGPMSLSAVAPTAVLGPVLGKDISFSVQAVERMLNGSMPGLPRLGFTFVDVRDIADLHVKAMTAPQAAGQRLLGAGQFLWLSDVAQILHDRLGRLAGKVPSRKLPSLLVRAIAIFDPGLRSVVNELDRPRIYSSDKAGKLLDWKSRPIDETIVDCAQSLIHSGVAPAA